MSNFAAISWREQVTFNENMKMSKTLTVDLTVLAH